VVDERLDKNFELEFTLHKSRAPDFFFVFLDGVDYGLINTMQSLKNRQLGLWGSEGCTCIR
jgi:hypothetical protein